MSSVVTASGSTAPYAILSLIEQENSTGSWEKGGGGGGEGGGDKDNLHSEAPIIPVESTYFRCLQWDVLRSERWICYLADSSNVTSEPIGIQISDVMTIYWDDTWRKGVIVSIPFVKVWHHQISHSVRSRSPASGSYSLSSSETRVDFPDPLGPTTAMMLPAGTSRLRFWKMGASLRVG